MQNAVKRPAESAGKLFPPPYRDAGAVAPAHQAPAGECEAALPAWSPVFTRRSMVATLVAALTPAVGTAVALPEVVETAAAVLTPEPAAAVPVPPAAENSELLALGAEVGPKLDAYRAAAAGLVEARATALDLWPAVPADIVLTTSRQRGFFGGCYDLERDLDGEVAWPDQVMVEGTLRLVRSPTQILQAEPLRALLEDLRADPENDPELDADLAALLDIADGYEAACGRARAVLAEASDRCADAARALCDLAWKVRECPPKTIAGVMVHARVLAAYSEAEGRAGGVAGAGHAGVILGRGLADAVLRVAGAAA